jgi:glycosyltransferase involved in cell wall biosynthesis
MDNQSLILTVHNKGFLIDRVLNSIKDHTDGTYELLIVLDGCTDDSEEKVTKFIKENPQIKTNLIYTPDVFETKANNTALKEVNSDTAIIIQDDMVINEKGWNVRLTKPFRAYDNVFGVTANCSHNWEINPNSKHLKTTVNNNREWSDILKHVDHANRRTIGRDVFAIRQCVNRGPLALNYKDVVALDFLDEKFAPLDMDDHDLCFRMMEKLGKIVGCYWIDYISQPNWGGTRINGKPAPWQLESNQKNTRIVYDRHKDKIVNKIIENRILK